MSVTRLQRVLRVCDFGLKPVKYAEALGIQEKLAELCTRKKAPDTLLQLQVSSAPQVGTNAKSQTDLQPHIHDAGATGLLSLTVSAVQRDQLHAVIACLQVEVKFLYAIAARRCLYSWQTWANSTLQCAYSKSSTARYRHIQIWPRRRNHFPWPRADSPVPSSKFAKNRSWCKSLCRDP